jgi:hypothetical protein
MDVPVRWVRGLELVWPLEDSGHRTRRRIDHVTIDDTVTVTLQQVQVPPSNRHAAHARRVCIGVGRQYPTNQPVNIRSDHTSLVNIYTLL